MNDAVFFLDLGCIDLEKVAAMQDSLWKKRVLGAITDTVIFSEHPPSISVHQGCAERDLLCLKVPIENIAARGMPIIQLKRGGSIAVHGPGILGCYAVMRSQWPNTVRNRLEVWLLRATAQVVQLYPYPHSRGRKTAEKFPAKYRGLWHNNYKIATFGLSVASGVSRFGFNVNISPDQELLSLIHPCSIAEFELGSLSGILKEAITVRSIKSILKNTPL